MTASCLQHCYVIYCYGDIKYHGDKVRSYFVDKYAHSIFIGSNLYQSGRTLKDYIFLFPYLSILNIEASIHQTAWSQEVYGHGVPFNFFYFNLMLNNVAKSCNTVIFFLLKVGTFNHHLTDGFFMRQQGNRRISRIA